MFSSPGGHVNTAKPSHLSDSSFRRFGPKRRHSALGMCGGRRLQVPPGSAAGLAAGGPGRGTSRLLELAELSSFFIGGSLEEAMRSLRCGSSSSVKGCSSSGGSSSLGGDSSSAAGEAPSSAGEASPSSSSSLSSCSSLISLGSPKSSTIPSNLRCIFVLRASCKGYRTPDGGSLTSCVVMMLGLAGLALNSSRSTTRWAPRNCIPGMT